MEDNEKNALIDFGKAVKHARKIRKMSQSDLEELTGISVTYISSIEKGMRNPSLTSILKLCNALRLDSQIHFLMATWSKNKNG